MDQTITGSRYIRRCLWRNDIEFVIIQKYNRFHVVKMVLLSLKKALKKVDYFQNYAIILLVVSLATNWIAKSVRNSNGVTTQMAMWKRIVIFYEEIYAGGF